MVMARASGAFDGCTSRVHIASPYGPKLHGGVKSSANVNAVNGRCARRRPPRARSLRRRARDRRRLRPPAARRRRRGPSAHARRPRSSARPGGRALRWRASTGSCRGSGRRRATARPSTPADRAALTSRCAGARSASDARRAGRDRAARGLRARGIGNEAADRIACACFNAHVTRAARRARTSPPRRVSRAPAAPAVRGRPPRSSCGRRARVRRTPVSARCRLRASFSTSRPVGLNGAPGKGPNPVRRMFIGVLFSRKRRASFLRKPSERFYPHRSQGTANTRSIYRAGFGAAHVDVVHRVGHFASGRTRFELSVSGPDAGRISDRGLP